MTNIFATPANFNRPLYQSQLFIRTLNIFPYYLSYLLLIQHKKFNFKHIFYFLKIVKGGYLNYLLLIQYKNFNFKAHFLFSKKCKGGTLDKYFCNSCKLYQATVPKSGLHSNFKYFSILFELPFIDSSQKF